MKRLSTEAFERAARFLKTRSRPIDRAVFEMHFEGAHAEKVIDTLAAYQNADGGFGNALEPDVRLPGSSALATDIGLRLLREAGAGKEHPMVRRAVQYLLDTFDPQARVWRIVPPEASNYPHAPWWHDDGQSLSRTFGAFLINPRAGLLAELYASGEGLPQEWLEGLAEETTAYVESHPLDGHAFTNTVRLAEAPGLPARLHDRLAAQLRMSVLKAVERDPSKWVDYCLPPVWAAPTPGSLLREPLDEALKLHLDYLIDHQSAEGCWEPFWSWGDFYPEVWEQQVKDEWRGELTLRTLRSLKAYGRVS